MSSDEQTMIFSKLNVTLDTEGDNEKCTPSREDDLPPDGGRTAWLVIFAIFSINIVQGGYLVSWGVRALSFVNGLKKCSIKAKSCPNFLQTFQAFYETSLLSKNSPSSIAWIGSIQYALDYTPGLLAGRLLDAGHFRVTLLVSCMALTIANFTVPQCREFYQFLLSQAILYGIGSGFLYTPCLAIISHYFDKKRPIAYAIVTAGGAIGGVLYPIMFRRLEPNIGFPWTMRIFGFFQLVIFVLGVIIIKPRRSPAANLPKLLHVGGVISSPAYICYAIAIFLAFMALFTPLTFMTVKGINIGIQPNIAFYLVSIVNAATIPGRIIGGLVANRFGALNLTILTTILSVGFIIGWAVTESQSVYIGMAICYGIGIGGFLGLFMVPVAQMGNVGDAGRRTGIQMTILSIGALIGPPISGAIQEKNSDFTLVGVYAAVIMAASTVLMVIAKRFHVGKGHLLKGIF
ncbi:major facilitator superfamily domain-containing protein [Rhodocollybia butyracea]|uniref:Major facilitator superfamily domain-containing protein n=1 Tax=Rhodocollybia butyracea TaxID=206335 RepID=A0A9P5U4G2_9AGAR|nr:major facilitator superfamily domain-containing protein [Rhodocollybia butyracea]